MQTDKASSEWSILHTRFLTPPVLASVKSTINKLASVTAISWGGYPQAERRQMIIGREEMLEGFSDNPEAVGEVAAVKVLDISYSHVIYLSCLQIQLNSITCWELKYLRMSNTAPYHDQSCVQCNFACGTSSEFLYIATMELFTEVVVLGCTVSTYVDWCILCSLIYISMSRDGCFIDDIEPCGSKLCSCLLSR